MACWAGAGMGPGVAGRGVDGGAGDAARGVVTPPCSGVSCLGAFAWRRRLTSAATKSMSRSSSCWLRSSCWRSAPSSDASRSSMVKAIPWKLRVSAWCRAPHASSTCSRTSARIFFASGMLSTFCSSSPMRSSCSARNALASSTSLARASFAWPSCSTSSCSLLTLWRSRAPAAFSSVNSSWACTT